VDYQEVFTPAAVEEAEASEIILDLLPLEV
jgi:hypothetical protein